MDLYYVYVNQWVEFAIDCAFSLTNRSHDLLGEDGNFYPTFTRLLPDFYPTSLIKTLIGVKSNEDLSKNNSDVCMGCCGASNNVPASKRAHRPVLVPIGAIMTLLANLPACQDKKKGGSLLPMLLSVQNLLAESIISSHG